ncbi:MAG: hypothetical protein IJJ80_08925, partial [Clostridia bacterium]|nr:hypothetical protein [Clostridia bacterium]
MKTDAAENGGIVVKQRNRKIAAALLLTAALLAVLYACSAAGEKARAPGTAVSLAYENPATF